MKKVKLLTRMANPERTHQPGEVIELEDDQARVLVEAHSAEYVEDEKPVDATPANDGLGLSTATEPHGDARADALPGDAVPGTGLPADPDPNDGTVPTPTGEQVAGQDERDRKVEENS